MNRHTLNMPVIHLADWSDKALLIEIGGSCWPIFLVVEADTVSSGIGDQ